MKILRFFQRNKQQKPQKTIIREGAAQPADEVFDAWTSKNLDQMISLTSKQTSKVDRHFLLQGIVDETYKLREQPNHHSQCIKYSKLHLKELPELVDSLKESLGGTLPRITTFQKYATLLTEDGAFDEAIDVCKLAISYGLKDGTKSGFEGRIERIKKKMKNASTDQTSA